MFNYNDIFSQNINNLKAEGRYRVFAPIIRCCKSFPKANYIINGISKDIILWCSNDYLGQGCNSKVIEAICESTKTCGAGAGGTRNISGNSHYHNLLEQKIAQYHHKEAALIFSSGYVANEAAISTIIKILPDAIVFSDEKNHASIIAGIKASGAKKHIFEHNNMSHLEQLLKLYPQEQPKIIIFESVYSMDGDFGDITSIVKLAKKYGALTYIDEVHAIGMYGATGAGLTEQLGLQNDIDIIQATLGKAIGCVGGYIATNKIITDVIRSNASGFIFTTSIPPALANGSLASINYLSSEEGQNLRKKHQHNVALLKNKLLDYQLPILKTESHIIPLMIYQADLCKEVSKILLDEYNIYIQPINYPTVKKGQERLRITATPFHTEQMMDDLADALDKIWQILDLPRNI